MDHENRCQRLVNRGDHILRPLLQRHRVLNGNGILIKKYADRRQHKEDEKQYDRELSFECQRHRKNAGIALGGMSASPAEIVVEPFDIVLAEIISGLGFDKDQRFRVVGVFDAMGGSCCNIDRLAGFD